MELNRPSSVVFLSRKNPLAQFEWCGLRVDCPQFYGKGVIAGRDGALRLLCRRKLTADEILAVLLKTAADMPRGGFSRTLCQNQYPIASIMFAEAR